MSTRTKNIAFALGVMIVLFLGWEKSSLRRSTALAADAPTAASASDGGCACAGNQFDDSAADKLGADASPEEARMHRMSANLLKRQLKVTPDAASRQRAEWAERFHKQRDPLLREEIVTEMVQLDDAQTLDTMMGFFNAERNAGVRDQIILILGFMHATTVDMPKVCQMLSSSYDRDSDADERERMLDIISNIPKPESVAVMQHAFTAPHATVDDRFNAAEGLFKLAPRVKVDAEFLQAVTQRLQHDATSSESVHERSIAAQALAAPGQNNKAFLCKLLDSEQDAKLKKFLILAAEEYPTR